MSIPDERHKDCVKIGETSIDEDYDGYPEPNSEVLNRAACSRIDEYTKTAGINYTLLHTEFTLFIKGSSICLFNDRQVHEVLRRSGVKKKEFDGVKGADEWYCCDLTTAKKAIRAVKNGQDSLNPEDVSQTRNPILFRPEQQAAIEETKKQFKRSNKMLWNAKMRFGKTLCALQVVKEMQFKRTLILTHRPVVNEGWYEDFQKIFCDRNDYRYGSHTKGNSFDTLERDLLKKGIKYIYFVSMQDMRGAQVAGGKFDKNNEVFSTDWDFLIVDEAHEGTQTKLGQAVITELIKKNTKVLNLSGTPFNQLDQYTDEQIYTWDYVMEQRAKMEWEKKHPATTNPYACLPAIKIYTYDLGTKLTQYVADENAFNFREFFRTKEDGTFVYERDVDNFLNLLCKNDKENQYPYTNETFRKIFRHTLWIVPGVKAAKALSAKLREHPVFGYFEIVNVAGDGDEDEENRDALEMVKKAIGIDPDQTRTITLSCGRLTTGVSVPPWTGVFLMAGSSSTSAAGYMQTLFRVQTPYAHNGRMKEECYAFDFAPDRTLRVLAETAKVSAKAGKSTKGDREILEEFLNFCPIISIQGSQMKSYDVDEMMRQIKRAKIEQVVNRGFEDGALYNDKLLHLTNDDLKAFKNLKGIIGETQAMPKTGEIEVNKQGFDNEEYEKIKKKPKRERTPEEQARLKEMKELYEQRRNAISILRGISIRMPLLIFGAELKDEEELTIDNFTDIVDDTSWEEFMPKGVTKELFKDFRQYYDPDIFREAGKRIRDIARAADKLTVEERIERITALFSTFRNPDKETVLTPWRVVNMHLGDTLGGWCFFDKEFDKPLEEPRYIDRGNVTDEVFSPDTHLLEINSKSGLYPLYLTYNVYRRRLKELLLSPETLEEQQKIWDETVAENIFVLCKTPMAKSITRRTLVGFRDTEVHAVYYKNLIETIIQNPDLVVNTLRDGKNFWKVNNKENMVIDAVIGNPPYQVTVAKAETDNGQKRSSSIFQHFQNISDKIARYTSLIYPGSRWIHRSGKGMEQFGLKQINSPCLSKLYFFPDSTDIFKNVGIADGLTIVFKDMRKREKGFQYIYSKGEISYNVQAKNPGKELMPLNPLDAEIVDKVKQVVFMRFKFLHDSILSQKLFSIESDFVEKNPSLVREYKEGESLDADEIKLFTNDKAGKSGRAMWFVAKQNVIATGKNQLNRWKVVVSSANAGGQKRANQLSIMDNHSAFGRSRVALKTFETEREAQNFFRYCNSELIRYTFLLTDEALTSVAKLVPDIQLYTDDNGVLDFNGDIDAQLYDLFHMDKKEQKYIQETLAEKWKGIQQGQQEE